MGSFFLFIFHRLVVGTEGHRVLVLVVADVYWPAHEAVGAQE